MLVTDIVHACTFIHANPDTVVSIKVSSDVIKVDFTDGSVEYINLHFVAQVHNMSSQYLYSKFLGIEKG